MKILVVNTGSSSLKIEWIEIRDGNAQTKRARISVERIGESAKISFHESPGKKETRVETLQNVTEAFRLAVNWLKRLPDFSIDVIGHRVVHGGNKFTAPTLLSAEVLAEIEKLNSLAPLHNPVALEAVRAAQKEFPNAAHIAVFDTAFHRTIPAHAATYALPRELSERLNIRRYGFHGIAHESMLRRYGELKGEQISGCTLITLQLGSGCSITAIQNGKSVDTSMGFTPLEGLIMATRSGDIDPGLFGYLARNENLSVAELDRLLNERSGLLGISGCSSDLRDLFAAEKSDPPAALAIEAFCYRIRKYIGAYLAVLEDARAIVFGGGIGENQSEIRERICRGLKWNGIRLDALANANTRGSESCISTPGSTMEVWVIPPDEAKLIAESVSEIHRV